MNISKLLTVALIAAGFCSRAFAAVPAEEAAKLGTTLTLFGAEAAGSADGQIPPYTGGVTTLLTITHNTIYIDRSQTDAIGLFDDFGVQANRTITSKL